MYYVQHIIILWASAGILLFIFVIFFFVMETGLFLLEFPLFVVRGIDMSLIFVGDFYAFMFSFIVLLISFMIVLFTKYYIDEDKTQLGFYLLLGRFIRSIIILVYSPNLIMLLLG